MNIYSRFFLIITLGAQTAWCAGSQDNATPASDVSAKALAMQADTAKASKAYEDFRRALAAEEAKIIAALEARKADCMKRNNLDGANAVAVEIRKVQDGLLQDYVVNDWEQKNAAVLMPTIASRIVGQWKIYDTKFPDAWSGIITIKPTLTYEVVGAMGFDGPRVGKVEVKHNTMTISAYPYKFDLSTRFTGKIYNISNGGPRTMEFIK